MKTIRSWALVVKLMAVMLLLLGATGPLQPDAEVPDISKRINDFSIDLLKHTAVSPGAPANTILSPQSVFHGLAMSYVASGGETRDELASVLHFPEDNRQLLKDLSELRRQLHAAAEHKRMDVSMANALWLDETYADFRKEYVKDVKGAFDAVLHRVKFAEMERVSNQINEWVSEKTRGKIRKSVAPSDFESRGRPESRPGIMVKPALVTVNAVYFKADWGSQFDKESTCKRPFHIDADTTRETTMMHQRSLLLYSEDETVQFLEIPYIDGSYSMYIILPKELLSVGALTDTVTTGMVAGLKRSVGIREVDVLLPKFEMKSHYGMKNALSEMGVGAAFDDEKADFDKMIIKNIWAYRIYISEIYHDAWIDVDEKGTEAAAATTTTHYSVGCSAAPVTQPVQFHADHPFLFLIVHNPSHSILFAGWMSNPDMLE